MQIEHIATSIMITATRRIHQTGRIIPLRPLGDFRCFKLSPCFIKRNPNANTRKIVTGLILIIAVLIPSLNRELLASLKLKFIYKGNKNVEALNIRTAEEIKVLKRNLESLKQDTSLEQAEKAAKMEKIEKNITNLQKKCKEQTDIWIKEQQEDEKRAKARFAAK